MAYLDIRHLQKQFGTHTVVHDFNLQVEEGEFVTFLGPSGCGKTTVLRMIAGFEHPSAGSIHMGGENITRLAAQKRGIGMVFQNYALFPNMSVSQNVAFGLKMRHCTAGDIRRKVGEVLDLVELTGKEDHYPHTLSGGQRQRVALARALVVAPRILLLDEPLSALDARIRRVLREQIRDIQRRLGLTTVFVTHDQEEALTLSDRILLLNQGRIEQAGRAEAVYSQPATAFVARFMGNYNLLDAAQTQRLLGLEIDGQLAIRPESILLDDTVQPGHTALNGTVQQYQLLGNIIRYQVRCQDITLLVDQLNRHGAHLKQAGQAVQLQLNHQALHIVQ
jgi:putative spermidine/putrescine transport system ATP-binding protein